MTFVERFDRTLINTMSMALLVSGITLIGWGLVLFTTQCAGWLKFGAWQSVPIYALWLSPVEQFNQLVPMTLWEADWGPLSIVPSLSDQASLDHISQAVVGSLAGVAKILGWVLSSSLGAALTLSGLGCLFGSSAVAESHLFQGRIEEGRA